MTKDEIIKHCDLALLKPNASNYLDWINAANELDLASVCVPSSVVSFVYQHTNHVVSAVVGFPFGNCSTYTKVSEALSAIVKGASEVDVVMHIGHIINGDDAYIQHEVAELRKAIGHDAILKVIIETCYLNHYQKVWICDLMNYLPVDYVKTSTGFGPAGATLEDVELMRSVLHDHVLIKASGGIRTYEQAEQFINAGADRIGTSGLRRNNYEN